MVKFIKCLTLGFNSVDPKIYRLVLIDRETGEIEDIYNSDVLEDLMSTPESIYLTKAAKLKAMKNCKSSIYNEEKIAEKFKELVEKETIFVGVGCKYDIECLQKIVNKCQKMLDKSPKLLDLIKAGMSKNMYQNLRYTYYDMCERYEVKVTNRYDALEYAKNSQLIFEKMYKS